MNNKPQYLPYDWFAWHVPPGVELGADAYVDTSYTFAACRAHEPGAVQFGEASGAYRRSTLVVGEEGRVRIGNYSCLNGSYLVCEREVVIGNGCLVSWGVVITDCWPDATVDAATRRRILTAVGDSTHRHPPASPDPQPVTIGDYCWIGFDSIILPGVTLGEGVVVGCRAVVTEDVPPYSVVVGHPARVVRQLQPLDAASELAQLMKGDGHRRA